MTNKEEIWFVAPFAQGGDLFHLLVRVEKIEEKYARLYLAEIILAVDYIHSKNILHKDIKVRLHQSLVCCQKLSNIVCFRVRISSSTATETRALGITQRYRAPEVSVNH